ncbi:hypothetical protein I8H83_04540 [Candidatus Saccharibacteria bacterium]|mgnify:CR=1 FL=1|nr:hypothetical protein [Candidatus Saccharibacteria bacterium]
MSTTYIPGVCNIGPAEIRMRRMTGYIGLAITLVLFVIFYLVPIDAPWRLLVFIPATLAATGFLQAYLHFCAKFGMSGLFNVGDDMKEQHTVDQIEFRKKDQQKAITIIAGSAAIGVAVALLAYFLPFAS